MDNSNVIARIEGFDYGRSLTYYKPYYRAMNPYHVTKNAISHQQWKDGYEMALIGQDSNSWKSIIYNWRMVIFLVGFQLSILLGKNSSPPLSVLIFITTFVVCIWSAYYLVSRNIR